MDVLVIGGTRFVGAQLTVRLVAAGHRVTLFNRGRLGEPFIEPVRQRLELLQGDRTTSDFQRLLGGRRFDAVIDFAAYTGDDVRRVVEIFDGAIGHYVFISTGQVYLVRQEAPRPARESDYHGPLQLEPPHERDRAEWRYGIGKREAEDALEAAFRKRGFPSTRLRLPMVHGERDYYRRVESYLYRLLDGGPILLPDHGLLPMRHVYGGAVVRCIVGLLEDRRTFGRAYNLAQEETPSLHQFVELLGELVGATPRLCPVSSGELVEAGLDPVLVSPLSGRWMSFLDPQLAQKELRFAHERVRDYLLPIVASILAHPAAEPPPSYRRRSDELAVAARL